MDFNQEYYNSLYKKFNSNDSLDLSIFHADDNSESNIFPLALLADAEIAKDVNVVDYNELTVNRSLLEDVSLRLVKMHAGLGSSVKRVDLLKKWVGRNELGSKGTDLYIELNNKYVSLAELQLKQVEILNDKNLYKSVKIQNLVNDETVEQVDAIVSNYKDKIKVLENIIQEKMPTINEGGEKTTERVAPAGHAFLGFYLLSNLMLENSVEKELIVIGNGEDLNSTVDEKISSWVFENDIPIVMITTTKLEKDKKGGQISLVKNEENNFVTIIEKAQAEKANQLSYFEEIGLREKDNKSLFNTNIVLINSKALKKKLDSLKEKVSIDEFKDIISPDLIKNVKEQDGKKFTQLEGAIGSTLLNLDKFFRLNCDDQLISFLNLDEKAREQFFIPIKKIEDFNDILKKYNYSSNSGRFELKD